MLGQLIYGVVPIQTLDANGELRGSGTGFILQLEASGFKVPLIITARHVVEDAAQLRIRFHQQLEDGRPAPGPGRTATLPGGPPIVFPHPDPTVDIAAIQLLHFTAVAISEGWKPFYQYMPPQAAPEPAFLAKLEAIEEVYMIGYPNGVFDSHNNLPVARSGITATPAMVDYEGRPEFLVDMAVYYGSSGSPVFVRKTHQFINADGLLQENAQLRWLGVLHSGHHLDETGEISAYDGAPPAQVRFRQMINLGVCVRAETVLALKELVRAASITQASWETARSPA
jgi:hypothetical protein